jgi:hypothetical protein
MEMSHLENQITATEVCFFKDTIFNIKSGNGNSSSDCVMGRCTAQPPHLRETPRADNAPVKL